MTGPAEQFAALALKRTCRGPLTDAEVRLELDAGRCRWCDAPAIRFTPCSCARAQEEARRIRAGS